MQFCPHCQCARSTVLSSAVPVCLSRAEILALYSRQILTSTLLRCLLSQPGSEHPTFNIKEFHKEIFVPKQNLISYQGNRLYIVKNKSIRHYWIFHRARSIISCHFACNFMTSNFDEQRHLWEFVMAAMNRRWWKTVLDYSTGDSSDLT